MLPDLKKHFSVDPKYHNFEEYLKQENQSGLDGKIATHHLKLFHLAAAMQQPVVVEFGVKKGLTTCVFLEACEKNGGVLFSIDISDCSDVSESSV